MSDLELLLAEARSDDWERRARATAGLAAAGSTEADAELARLLDDADTAVIDAAARALLRRGDPRAFELVAVGAMNTDDDVVQQIADVAGELQEEGVAVREGLAALTESPRPDVREAAACLLADIQSAAVTARSSRDLGRAVDSG